MITYKISKNGNTTKVFAQDGENIVGCGEILIALDCADIIDIEVRAEYRRRGIGRNILSLLIAATKDSGVETITLEVRKSNAAAQNLYESFGFRPISVRERYYDDKEDAVVMQLKCS
ncbi:MAG: ribosomal protein S18-alanine N-acetyltransferase [Oscillospiraceae bacterium]|nr:ribosomal protein S18-alanine N-acetyltransferase [Oscillospiraceae bacterium]